MGRPQATAVMEAKGAYKNDPGRKNPAEPQPTLHAPPRPAVLDGDDIAISKWFHLCEMLEELGVAAVTDGDLMTAYCRSWSEWVRAFKAVDEEGSVVSGRRNPKCVVGEKALAVVMKLIPELGLSPSSRSRLIARPMDDDDPIKKFVERNLKPGKN